MNRSVILTHALGWFTLLSLPIIVIIDRPDSNSLMAGDFAARYVLFSLPYIFLFYFNVYFLIPKLYLQKKIITYAFIILFLLALIFFIRPFDTLFSNFFHLQRNNEPPAFTGPPPGFAGRDMHDRMPGPPHKRFPRFDIVSSSLFIIVWALSMAYEISKRWRVTEQRAARAEADKANAELSFLKAQINPHFLFNTLNNIYSLAVTKNENTAVSIMKLSNIMRYVTDDVTQDFVPLQSEVECISNYIDLQKLRLSKKVTVNYNVLGDLDNKTIAPLILMTFIENTFKYGISNHEAAEVSIQLIASHDSISFFCQNPLFSTERKIERTGIGIENTKQRLAHLYPEQHSLHITSEDGLYTVSLVIIV
ncbi:sensor histidine kinase [Chitinophagaceae bacterium LWZ2-11]